MMGFIRILLANTPIPGIINKEISVIGYFQNKLNIITILIKHQQKVSPISFGWQSPDNDGLRFRIIHQIVEALCSIESYVN